MWCRVSEETTTIHPQVRSERSLSCCMSRWCLTLRLVFDTLIALLRPMFACAEPHWDMQHLGWTVEERVGSEAFSYVAVLSVSPLFCRCVCLSMDASFSSLLKRLYCCWWLQMLLNLNSVTPLLTTACCTVLTDDVLIYSMLTKVSEALSSRSVSLRPPHNVSLPLGLLSYRGRSGWSVVCLPKAIQHIWLQLEIYAVAFFWPEMEIDCKI